MVGEGRCSGTEIGTCIGGGALGRSVSVSSARLTRLLIASGGSIFGDVLAVARALDVQPNGVHDEPVENRGGDGGIAEVVAPFAEGDIGGNGGCAAGVPLVDEIEEGVRRGGLAVVFFDVANTDVVDDKQRRTDPAAQALGVGGVGESGVQIVEQVDGSDVTKGQAAFTGPETDGLEDMALTRAGLAGNDDILGTSGEVETGELDDGVLVQRWLKVPVEGFEGLPIG